MGRRRAHKDFVAEALQDRYKQIAEADLEAGRRRLKVRRFGALQCELDDRGAAESADELVVRCKKQFSFLPEFDLRGRLDDIFWRHRQRRQRSQMPNRRDHEDHLRMIREFKSLVHPKTGESIATTLEIIALGRCLPKSHKSLPDNPAEICRLATLALRQIDQGEPGRKPDVALRVLYNRLIATYEEGTGRRPVVPPGPPYRGKTFRFVAECCAVLGESEPSLAFRKAVVEFLKGRRGASKPPSR